MSDFKFLEGSASGHSLSKLSEADVAAVDNIFPIPKELREFYITTGYGFFHQEYDSSINRLIGPGGFKAINLREGHYEFDPELDSYEDDLEAGRLIFFEVNEGIYLTIDKTDHDGQNAIYYNDDQIAPSLESFLRKFDSDPDFIDNLE